MGKIDKKAEEKINQVLGDLHSQKMPLLQLQTLLKSYPKDFALKLLQDDYIPMMEDFCELILKALEDLDIKEE